MRLILISVSRAQSSGVTGSLRCFVYGFRPASIVDEHALPRLAVLDLLVDLLLDEDLLQREHVPAGIELAEPDLQLPLEQVARALRRDAEDVGDAGERRLVVEDDDRIRVDENLAFREGVERILRQLRIAAGQEVDRGSPRARRCCRRPS